MKIIDDFLNSITMYRLMFYVLIVFLAIALILSFFKILPFDPLNLFSSAVFLILICWAANKILAKVFNVPTNFESVYITALILTLIITPATNFNDFLILGLIGIFSQVSKYILAIQKKHIFNPAALAIVFAALVLNRPASWWIGTPYMMPLVAIGGLLIVRKIRRFSMVVSFFIVYSIFTLGSGVQKIILDTPILFFAFIMLTEPQTTPPTNFLQILYGGLSGFGSSQFSLEIALILGNIFSYIVSPKEKLILKLTQKIQLSPNIYEFIFGLNQKFKFTAGQYMEWTLSVKNGDSRGNRRYFTLASSPTEDNLRIGVRVSENGSAFKKRLLEMVGAEKIIAGSLAGDFTLPKEPEKKLVFIAGGIGITPFRSMIKYILDEQSSRASRTKNEKRDIVLLYSNKTESDIVYKDIFDEASRKLAIKVVYVNTDKMGYINEEMIKKEVADYKERIFYLSGPHSMVDSFKKTLEDMDVASDQIKIDFFPGYV